MSQRNLSLVIAAVGFIQMQIVLVRFKKRRKVFRKIADFRSL